MKVQEISNSLQTGFFWGIGFTFALILVSALVSYFFHFRVGVV